MPVERPSLRARSRVSRPEPESARSKAVCRSVLGVALLHRLPAGGDLAVLARRRVGLPETLDIGDERVGGVLHVVDRALQGVL